MVKNLRPAHSAALVCLAAAALTGCKPDAAIRKGEVFDKNVSPQHSATVDDAGVITGIVSFKGQPPARVPIDMSMDPACSLAAGQNLSEQYIVSDGKLANVFVYVKDYKLNGGAIVGRVSTGETLDQKNCRYTPHVIAVYKGDGVTFLNSDPTMHNIHVVLGDQTIDVSQGPGGAPQRRKFDTPAIMVPIRCNNHPWMEAFLNVSPTPWFAVTREDGTFSIPGLPPGTYTLAAVHEKLGERDMQVTVTAKSQSKADFGFAMK
jgi:plastocyanin